VFKNDVTTLVMGYVFLFGTSQVKSKTNLGRISNSNQNDSEFDLKKSNWSYLDQKMTFFDQNRSSKGQIKFGCKKVEFD